MWALDGEPLFFPLPQRWSRLGDHGTKESIDSAMSPVPASERRQFLSIETVWRQVSHIVLAIESILKCFEPGYLVCYCCIEQLIYGKMIGTLVPGGCSPPFSGILKRGHSMCWHIPNGRWPTYVLKGLVRVNWIPHSTRMDCPRKPAFLFRFSWHQNGWGYAGVRSTW